jgi:hypothetical protein
MAHAQAQPPPLEALSLDERAGQQGGAPPPALGQALHPQQAPQQLPPQMFTTAAQLLDLTDSESHLRLWLWWEDGWLGRVCRSGGEEG